MSRQLNVERDIEFVGEANQGDNVWGNISYERIVLCDDFQGKAIDTTNDYNLTTVNAGTATVTVPHMMTITTNNKDDDNTEVATGVAYYPWFNPVLEARFRVDDITNSAFNICFNDAFTEGSDDLVFELDGVTQTINGADCAGFFYDLSATTANIFATSAKSGGAGTYVFNTETAIVDEQLYTVRIELRDNGTTTDAFFYFNSSGKEIDPLNDLIGVEIDAVHRENALCAYMGLINRVDAIATTMDIDYLKIWSSRR